MKTLARHRALLAVGSSLALLAGCSPGESGETTPDDGPTYVRDIAPLIEAKCVSCHTEGGIAPFSLETYDDVVAMKEAVAGAVAARVMPPWQAADGCADYQGSLTEAQIELVKTWVEADAKLGAEGDAPVNVPDERLTLSRVDLELPLPEPYTPQSFPDDYRCFLVDWPATGPTFVTGFGAVPGNQAIVHHMITYVAPPAVVSKFEELDAAEEGPGWACYGGPGGDGNGPKVSWLGGWAPGGEGQDFPEGTGVEIPTGSKLVVQIHYNSNAATAAPDQSKVLVKTDEAVKKKAVVLPFTDIEWLSGGMTIPAHSKDVVHSVSADPGTLVSLFSGGAFEAGKPLTVYSAGPHMHTLGRRYLTRIERADGSSECMLDIPRWNFHWQLQYNFATPKQMAPGDEIHLECQWDNPGAMDVSWGENTSDEMCLGVFYLTQ